MSFAFRSYRTFLAAADDNVRVPGPDFPTFVDIAPDGKGNWLLLDSSGARLFRVTL